MTLLRGDIGSVATIGWSIHCSLRRNKALAGLLLFLSIFAGFSSPAFSQFASSAQGDLSPSSLPPVQLAQTRPVVPTPDILPTDATPLNFRGGVFRPGVRFRLYQKLPERLFFNITTEVSQRLDTNVFFTNSNPRPDYAFRVLPNVTLGYNLFGNTSVYTNYFVIKDVFADNTILNFPTTMSLSGGIRQDFPIGKKFNVQVDYQVRELWQTSHLRQADMLPALNVQYFASPSVVLFGSALLQMRSRNIFQGPTRELDPFYTVGMVYRRGQWNFLATDTLVTNFRSPPFTGSIPRQGNVSMIADFEISHPVTDKIPGLLAFAKVEPIFNWSSHRTPGLSGVDVRVMTGLRMSFAKASYASSINKLRKQLGGAVPNTAGLKRRTAMKGKHELSPEEVVRERISAEESDPVPAAPQNPATVKAVSY